MTSKTSASSKKKLDPPPDIAALDWAGTAVGAGVEGGFGVCCGTGITEGATCP
jgi:hypothetical protein